jgi:hypothetical protein
VQSYGDSLNLHPHIHAIAASGVWTADGRFESIPALEPKQLMLLFRHHVIKNLLAAGRISQATVDILDRFHHPGFSAYEGHSVSPEDSASRERLASYLVHAPFSLSRLQYDRDSGIVAYDLRASQSSYLDSDSPQRLSPLDALAALTAFIPEKGLQLVCYYEYYSNKSRGQRRHQNLPAPAADPPNPDEAADDSYRRFCRRAWARLIRKVYLADSLACRTSWLASELVAESQRENVMIFGIAFTDQADFELIQTISQKTGGAHFRPFSASDISSVFTQVTDRIRQIRRQIDPGSLSQQSGSNTPANARQISSFLTWAVCILLTALFLAGLWAWRERLLAPPVPATLKDKRDSTRVYTLDRRTFKVGKVRCQRFRKNDLIIPQATINRAHATIRCHNGVFYIGERIGSISGFFPRCLCNMAAPGF